MTKEIWKEVPNYEDYMVSSRGRAKSLKFGKERLLKQSLVNNSYLKVTLSKEGNKKQFYIHVLVAIAFLGHVPDGHKLVVDHYPDKTKTNNNLSNLRLVTNRGNLSRRGGSSNYVGVSWFKRDSKWKSQIRINGKIKYLGLFTNELEAHEAYQKKLKEIQK